MVRLIDLTEKDAKVFEWLRDNGVLELLEKFIPPGKITIHINKKLEVRHKEIHEYSKEKEKKLDKTS